jgi:hypothetical protein
MGLQNRFWGEKAVNDKLKLLIRCIAILMVVVCFNYCFKEDTTRFSRVTFYELGSDGYVDVLFLGASHTQMGYNVSMIEENTGLNVYNAGAIAQKLQGYYYILKEAGENNGVKTVWLDMYYEMASVAGTSETVTYIVSDYLTNQKVKYEFLLEGYGVEGAVNGLFPVLHGSSLKPSVLKAHLTKDYITNPYKYLPTDTMEYDTQGYVKGKLILSENYEFTVNNYINTEKLLSDYSWKWLRKIIDYCNEKDIELVLVNVPMPDGQLQAGTYYDEYTEYIRNVAQEYGLGYYDFNLTKEGVLTMERSDYYDYTHLNGQGADKFSECVSKVLNGELDESAFYDTFAEKLANNPDGTAK